MLEHYLGTVKTEINNYHKSSQMLVFEERGNRSTRRKPGGAEKSTNKLNPHMTWSLGIEPRPHWWEASALNTAPSPAPHPCLFISINALKSLSSFFQPLIMSNDLRTISAKAKDILLNRYKVFSLELQTS